MEGDPFLERRERDNRCRGGKEGVNEGRRDGDGYKINNKIVIADYRDA